MCNSNRKNIDSRSIIILAGGKSTRMHMNKEFLKIQSNYIIHMSLTLLENYFDDIIVVSNNSDFYKDFNVKIVQDSFKNCGPLAGIHAGLLAIKNECAYVLACDMPYFDNNYYQYLYSFHNDYEIIISQVNEFVEPFQAIYHKKIILDIENLLLNKKFAISNLFNNHKVKRIDFNATTYSSKIFVNMNTKSDYYNYLLHRKDTTYDKAKKDIKNN